MLESYFWCSQVKGPWEDWLLLERRQKYARGPKAQGPRSKVPGTFDQRLAGDPRVSWLTTLLSSPGLEDPGHSGFSVLPIPTAPPPWSLYRPPTLPSCHCENTAQYSLSVCAFPKPRTFPTILPANLSTSEPVYTPLSPAPNTIFPCLSPSFSSGINSVNLPRLVL